MLTQREGRIVKVRADDGRSLTGKLFSESERTREATASKAILFESEFTSIVENCGLLANVKMMDADLDDNSCKT